MRGLFVALIVCVLFSCGGSKTNDLTGVNEEIPEGFQLGLQLFKQRCASCHGSTGEPQLALYPPLKNSDYLKNYPNDIPCIIQHGLQGEIVVNGQGYNMKMASNPDLTADQIQGLVNYINNAWGNDFGAKSLGEVKENLTNCK